MQFYTPLKIVLWAVVAFAVASCETSTTSSDAGFRKQYFAARMALEEGKYEKASRGYLRLMEEAGPLSARLRLEYAHSLLRAGDYPQAAAQAQGLAAGNTGLARAAALAVEGTARHEMGLAALSSGDVTQGQAQLQAAHAALTEVLDTAPDLDPLGGLAGRLASIDVRLR